MNVHIIEGEAGCRFAVDNRCVAVVIDALRASATAAMFLDAGAAELLITREVETARAAKVAMPDALLFGERGGLPPPGFDGGNSPRETDVSRGRRVIFTTTTGAGRLVAAWGARALYMGTTVNASAVVHAAKSHGADIVLIPAGLTGVVEHDAQEDRVAAVYLAQRCGLDLGEGHDMFDRFVPLIHAEGLGALFASSPHAEKLRQIGQDADIAWCAQVDITEAVPEGMALNEFGVVVRRH